ncbi:MAG: sigma factor-like helix-turn-helix DNA-binding protein [Dehalococcoidia bacterium]|nr:sigma factor-like helix-turn-helix DNA-binding protein [Dehalococcoidia bacterium]
MTGKKGPPAPKKEIIEYVLAHKDRPMALREIAEKWGISRQRVSQILKEAGIKGIFLMAQSGSFRAIGSSRLRLKLPEIIALIDQGVSLHAIARTFDYDRTTIRRALQAHEAGDGSIWRRHRGKPRLEQ